MAAGAGHNADGRPAFRAAAARAVLIVLLLAAATAAYYSSFTGVFVLDDHREIENNAHIRRLWPLGDVLVGNRARPVFIFTLAVNYALGGLNPVGYHAFNLTIHAFAAMVLFGLVRRTLIGPQVGTRYLAPAPYLAFAVALLWVVHPLQTSSVTYVTQRGEVLMGFFYLVVLYALSCSAQARWPRLWQGIAIAACAAGMGTKQVMVTAPVAALLYDRVFLAPSFREALCRRPLLYAGLGSTWAVLAVVGAVALSHVSAGFGATGVSPFEYAVSQPGVILHYLRLALWPHPLCFDYDWPVASTVGEVLPGLMMVGALLAATRFAWRRQPALGYLGAFFFLVLGVTSSVIPISDLAFEHRMYLPLAPVLVLLVLGAYEALGAAGSVLGRAALRRRLGAAMVVVTALALVATTIRRNADYSSEIGLWQDTVAKRPGHVRAKVNLGSLLFLEGRLDEAKKMFTRATALKPDQAQAQYGLGKVLSAQGSLEEAVQRYSTAVQLLPTYGDARNELARVLMLVGQMDQAKAQLREAIRLDPARPDTYNNLAAILMEQGAHEEAIGQLRKAIKLKPDNIEAHINLARSFASKGGSEEAILIYRDVLKVRPDLVYVKQELDRIDRPGP